MGSEVESERGRALEHRRKPFVEGIERRVLAARDGGERVEGCKGRLAGARRPEHQRRRARVYSAAEERVELRDSARESSAVEPLMVLRADEAGKDDDSSRLDVEVVIAAQEFDTPQLADLEAAP